MCLHVSPSTAPPTIHLQNMYSTHMCECGTGIKVYVETSIVHLCLQV